MENHRQSVSTEWSGPASPLNQNQPDDDTALEQRFKEILAASPNRAEIRARVSARPQQSDWDRERSGMQSLLETATNDAESPTAFDREQEVNLDRSF